MPDSDRHDQLLQELLSLHRQLATIPPGGFPARHELLGRIDLVRNELAALPKPVTEVERRFIKEELRSLKKLRADYADLVVGMRWGGSVPVLEFWRRRLRRTTLEDRPSFS